MPRLRRKAVGLERQGATRGAGRTHPPWSPLERNQGKRVPSVESSGGCCPDPRQLGRGVAGKELLAAAGEVRHPEGRREEKTAGQAEASGQRGHSPAPDLEGTCVHQSPKAEVSGLQHRGQWAGGVGGEPHPRRPRASTVTRATELAFVFKSCLRQTGS